MAVTDRTPLDPGLIDLALVRAKQSPGDAVMLVLRADKAMTAKTVAAKSGYCIRHVYGTLVELEQDGAVKTGLAKVGNRMRQVYWRAK